MLKINRRHSIKNNNNNNNSSNNQYAWHNRAFAKHYILVISIFILLCATTCTEARRSRIDLRPATTTTTTTTTNPPPPPLLPFASTELPAAGLSSALKQTPQTKDSNIEALSSDTTASSAELVQIPVQQPPSATASSTVAPASKLSVAVKPADDKIKAQTLIEHQHESLQKSAAIDIEVEGEDENLNKELKTSSLSATDNDDAAVVLPSANNLLKASSYDVNTNESNKSEQATKETSSEHLEQQQGSDNDKNNINNNIVQPAADNNNLDECDPEMLGFEIVTGYVYSAPGKLLESLPGTLMLTDCLDACQGNETCQAVNYETGLCVLFSANADQLPGALTKSQFPVFTIYAQKSCLGIRPCARAWCVDRVQNYKLIGHAKRSVSVTSRRDCLELCLGETEFTCRSANYYRATNTCELSHMDRITLAGTSAFQTASDIDYLENNCAEEPNKLCEFKRLSGRIMKTVDSVYQDVGSIDECRELCLNSPYRCHSYDYGDTGDMVCRLSHHSRATLSDVQDPYLDVPEAATYELASCYNVTVECGSGDMIARIRTSKLFDGKVYAKGSPKSCAVDVKSALDFELRMRYQDLECNVKQSGSGRYMNDVIIQHHDMIVTSSDLGLAVTCQYDLTNKSVTNDVDLGVKGDIEPALSEEVIVDSPNVVMKITSRDGSDIMRSAEVGDPLALKFEILDEQSPYEIFVRELIAMDGTDNAEITLIDSNGCPTDHFIMGPIYKSSLSGKVLLSHFDAFKFPSSEVVQFRALVTPCMPTCEPVQCNQEDITGEFKSLSSYGRRRRRSLNVTATFAGTYNAFDQPKQQKIKQRRSRRATTTDNITSKTSQDDMLLVQSIQITDKFGFDKHQQQPPNDATKSTDHEANETVFISSDSAQGFCVNAVGLIVAATVFLLAQLAVISIWTYLHQRRRKERAYENEAVSSSSNASSTFANHMAGVNRMSSSIDPASVINSNISCSTRSESLCKLYDSGFSGRHGRQF